MKGLVKYKKGKENMEIREIDVPDPGPDEVLVEVKSAGICGSDLHIYEGDIQIPMQYPITMGHEFSGKIVEVGNNVNKFQPDDKVTSETAYYTCGTCKYCITGNYNLCNERKGLGFWFNGAFAEYVTLPKKRLHKLPEKISYQEGALIEPFACAYNGVSLKTNIKAGDKILLTGPGTIGLLALQIANVEGGEVTVIGTDQDEMRLAKAKELGAKNTISIDSEEANQNLKEISGELGFDVVLECSGAPQAARLGLDLIKKRGQYSQIGLFGHPIEIDFELIAYKELKVSGSFSQKWMAWDKALKLFEMNKVNLEKLVTHTYKLKDWQEAFDKFQQHDSIKVILQP